jgi:hypothetical protein
MLKISIPTPCHEDWNKMIPDETGRHCSSCAKSVVDFTGMSDEEVKHFFLNKKEERVCGRFKQTQLQQIVIELPKNIFSIQMPLWKKFLAACLIVFSTTLFSCETKINDRTAQNTQTKDLKTDSISNDIYLGGIALMPDTVPVEVYVTTVGILIPEFVNDTTLDEVKGDIEIITVDATTPKQIDTLPVSKQPGEVILTGGIILTELPIKKVKIDSSGRTTKTKNPPKADSIDCNTIKNYY